MLWRLQFMIPHKEETCNWKNTTKPGCVFIKQRKKVKTVWHSTIKIKKPSNQKKFSQKTLIAQSNSIRDKRKSSIEWRNITILSQINLRVSILYKCQCKCQWCLILSWAILSKCIKTNRELQTTLKPEISSREGGKCLITTISKSIRTKGSKMGRINNNQFKIIKRCQ